LTTYGKVEGLTEEQEGYKVKYKELNGKKFIPRVAVADLLKVGTITKLFELSNRLANSEGKDRIGIVISDYDFETDDPSIIDIAVPTLY